MKYSIAVSAIALLLVGCAEDGTGFAGISSGGGSGRIYVSFSIPDGGAPDCDNPDVYEQNSSGDQLLVECTWYCADYRDQMNANVTIIFVSTHPGPWTVSEEMVRKGMCINTF